jgi:hypothetical protein
MSEVSSESIADRISASISPEAPQEVADAPPVAAEPPQEPVEAAEAPTEATEAPKADPEEQTLSTLSELAEHLEVDPAELYNLSVSVNQDGEALPVTLGELKDRFQSSDRLDKQAKEAQAAREAFEAETTQARQKFEHDVRVAARLVDNLSTTLTQEYQSIDWQGLREEDPAGWAAKRQEFTERQAQIQSAQREVGEAAHRHQAEQQMLMQQQQAQTLETERAALLDAIPEWQMPDKAKSGMDDLRGYLRETGWTDGEIDSASDHRSIVLARKAMLYDREVKTANAEQKRVVRIGKRQIKPGAKQDPAQSQRDGIKAEMASFRKSGGNVKDAAALISKLI